MTALVGALVALLPPALFSDKKKSYLSEENGRLRRSHAQLIDHIERLERVLALEQSMVAHWREEARRLAMMSREGREAAEARRHAALQAQQYNALANQQLAAQNTLAQYQQQANAYEGWCNCVPSRAQVWGSQNGLVQALNRGEA
jgi:pantothenate kinase-related protein Tda10